MDTLLAVLEAGVVFDCVIRGMRQVDTLLAVLEAGVVFDCVA